MANVRATDLNVKQELHLKNEGCNWQKPIGIALIIIGSCGLIVAASGVAGFFKVGLLSQLTQIQAIIMMGAGGGVGIVFLPGGIILCVKNARNTETPQNPLKNEETKPKKQEPKTLEACAQLIRKREKIESLPINHFVKDSAVIDGKEAYFLFYPEVREGKQVIAEQRFETEIQRADFVAQNKQLIDVTTLLADAVRSQIKANFLEELLVEPGDTFKFEHTLFERKYWLWIFRQKDGKLAYGFAKSAPARLEAIQNYEEVKLEIRTYDIKTLDYVQLRASIDENNLLDLILKENEYWLESNVANKWDKLEILRFRDAEGVKVRVFRDPQARIEFILKHGILNGMHNFSNNEELPNALGMRLAESSDYPLDSDAIQDGMEQLLQNEYRLFSATSKNPNCKQFENFPFFILMTKGADHSIKFAFFKNHRGSTDATMEVLAACRGLVDTEQRKQEAESLLMAAGSDFVQNKKPYYLCKLDSERAFLTITKKPGIVESFYVPRDKLNATLKQHGNPERFNVAKWSLLGLTDNENFALNILFEKEIEEWRTKQGCASIDTHRNTFKLIKKGHYVCLLRRDGMGPLPAATFGKQIGLGLHTCQSLINDYLKRGYRKIS